MAGGIEVGEHVAEAALPLIENQVSTPRPRRIKRFWRWAIPVGLIAIAAPVLMVQIVIARAGPILKGRVIDTLEARFGSDVQLDTLQVSIAHGVNVSGSGLRVFPLPEAMAAGYKTPVISVGRFDFQSTLSGLIFRPTHIGTVHVQGLAINIPPAGLRQKVNKPRRRLGKIRVRVDAIVCDDSELVIGTNKPDKDPRVFTLKHVVLRDLGPNSAWPYDAILTNPVPRGEIHAAGTFGPWNMEDPGNSNVSGKYTFENADLNTIKGIAGILQSTGNFNGQLDRIAVHGKTQVPDFSLDTANHPVPLNTEFHAIVDGTSGDTYLERIDAKLGDSRFLCSGAVVNMKGQGHNIHVSVNMEHGRMEDFLQLAAPTRPAPMSGSLALNADLDIRAGEESVTKKMTLKGTFNLERIHFTNPDIEDKVDILSLRARGQTENLKAGAPDVRSRMMGEFSMRNGQLTFPRLEYALPGGDVRLSGTYRLDGRAVGLQGKVQTTAQISEMVAAKWKKWLLKPLDPFFRKQGWGAVIPVKVTGSNGKVHFGYKF